MDGELTTDNTGFTAGKLVHDLEQLEFIVAEAPGAVQEAVQEALFAFRRLHDQFARFQEGSVAREEVHLQFYEVRPYFNRAIHVPDFSEEVSKITSFIGQPDFRGAKFDLQQKGLAILDGALATDGALQLVHRWLSLSTLWFQSIQEGQLMKAQLRDGLHGEVVLRLLQDLQDKWPFLQQYPVLDLVAYRHGSRSLGLPYHCLDGHLAAMLCFDETIVKISKENSHGCQERLVGPAPASNLEEFLREVPKTSPNAAMDTFPCRANSLVLWHPPRRAALQTGPGPSVPVDFAKRPVQLLVLWGENRVKVNGKGSNFAPSFEGKTDSWGEHYYAQDHDHR